MYFAITLNQFCGKYADLLPQICGVYFVFLPQRGGVISSSLIAIGYSLKFSILFLFVILLRFGHPTIGYNPPFCLLME